MQTVQTVTVYASATETLDLYLAHKKAVIEEIELELAQFLDESGLSCPVAASILFELEAVGVAYDFVRAAFDVTSIYQTVN